jgi:hypothetical protein
MDGAVIVRALETECMTPAEATTITDPSPLPSHEQIATFRVSALLGTQAVAAYVEPDRPGDPFASTPSFERLPAPLKIRVLEACEEAFRRRREAVARDERERSSA